MMLAVIQLLTLARNDIMHMFSVTQHKNFMTDMVTSTLYGELLEWASKYR